MSAPLVASHWFSAAATAIVETRYTYDPVLRARTKSVAPDTPVRSWGTLAHGAYVDALRKYTALESTPASALSILVNDHPAFWAGLAAAAQNCFVAVVAKLHGPGCTTLTLQYNNTSISVDVADQPALNSVQNVAAAAGPLPVCNPGSTDEPAGLDLYTTAITPTTVTLVALGGDTAGVPAADRAALLLAGLLGFSVQRVARVFDSIELLATWPPLLDFPCGVELLRFSGNAIDGHAGICAFLAAVAAMPIVNGAEVIGGTLTVRPTAIAYHMAFYVDGSVIMLCDPNADDFEVLTNAWGASSIEAIDILFSTSE